MENIHLVQWIRRLRLDWELDLEKLSAIAHVESAVLEKYLECSPEDLEAMPSVPPGLENAVSLVSIFQKLIRLHPEASAQNEWLVTSSPDLEDHKPIEVMAMSASHLSWVSYVLSSSMSQ